MSSKTLAIDLIRTDGGTQMRAELDRDVYLDYRDKMLAGVEFPPLDVFFDGSTYWLADGFHRFYGAREAKRGSVKATVHNGTQRDAILFAVGANTSHGLRRSNADKRNCVLALLNDEMWVKWSGEKIAEAAAVSANFVSEVKKQLSSDESSLVAKTKDEPKLGKDGKKRKPPNRKANGKLRTQSDEPAEAAEDTEPHPNKDDWEWLRRHIIDTRNAADKINVMAGRKGKYCEEFQETCGILDNIVREWRKVAK